MNIGLILKLLDGVIAGSIVLERVQALRAQLKQFQDEGRDPTDLEWQALFDEANTRSVELDEADKRLNG